MPEGYDRLTVASAAAFVISSSLAIHLYVTAFLAARFGEVPELVSSTGLVLDWSRLRDDEVIVAAAGASVASSLLAISGWLLVRRSRGRPANGAVVGWLLFSFNGWLVSAWMVVSSIVGVGGWMAIVDRFANRGPLRASVVAAGLFVLALVWKESVPSLAWMIGNGNAEIRRARARFVTRVAWSSAALVTAAAAAWTPISGLRSALVVGGLLLATAPMMAAAGGVGEHPVRGEALSVPRSWPMIVLGLGAAVLFVLTLGRGHTPV